MGRSRLRDRALTRSPRTGEVARPDASRGTFRFHDGLLALARPSSLPAGCSPVWGLDEDEPLTSLSPARAARAAFSRGQRSTSCKPSSPPPFGRETARYWTSQNAFHRKVPLLAAKAFASGACPRVPARANHPRTSRRDRARRPALTSWTPEYSSFALHDPVPFGTRLSANSLYPACLSTRRFSTAFSRRALARRALGPVHLSAKRAGRLRRPGTALRLVQQTFK